jgi:hypothetical protein
MRPANFCTVQKTTTLVKSKRKNSSGAFMDAPLSLVFVEAIGSRNMLGGGGGKVNVQGHSSSGHVNRDRHIE